MAQLDGTWTVERAGGLLPPLIDVRKTIEGGRGHTRVGRIPAAPFDVREPDGDGLRGRALSIGRELGRFRMRRRA